MHILYIHQHFATPNGSTGTRSYEFAKRWVKAGHKVTVITGYSDLSGLELENNKLLQKQTIEGINVNIIAAKYSNKQSYFRRTMSFLSVCFFSNYVGLMTKNVDVIFSTSTPLTVGIPATILKWLKRVPFIFEVRDQWPEVPIEMGIIRNRVLIKLLLWLEKTIYKKSAAIVALSPGMADGVRSVLKAEKPIHIVSNSSDTELFRPDIDGSEIRHKNAWGNKLVLLHFGAMSKANGTGFIVDVAERLKANTDICFVLIGAGHEKISNTQKIEQLGLNNITVMDSLPKAQLPKLVAACDISMVTLANYPILEHNSSNKFFDSLSAGKPILLNYSGWQRKIIEENKAGFGCEQGNLEEFAEKVLYMNQNRESLVKMGQNARRLAEEKFNRDKLAQQVLDVLHNTVEPKQ